MSAVPLAKGHCVRPLLCSRGNTFPEPMASAESVQPLLYQRLLDQLHELFHLRPAPPPPVIQDVVPVLAPIEQPAQRLAFALNAPLDARVAQPVAVAEEDHGSAPKPGCPSSRCRRHRLQLLLQSLLVALSERGANVDNQEEGAGRGQEVRGADGHLLMKRAAGNGDGQRQKERMDAARSD